MVMENWELVLDCVIPYIQDSDDLNSVSLVSKKCFDIDSLTRKHVTVHVYFLPNPKRLYIRFPNLQSLTLKSFSYKRTTAEKCSIPVTPWIHEIAAVKFDCLKSLCIRNMVVYPSDLKLLAATRGDSLRSLEIRGCNMFSEDGLIDIARYCKDLRSLRLDFNRIDGDANWKWLHELALCNTVMESLYVLKPFDSYGMYSMKDVTLLAKKCSKSLVSLNVLSHDSSDFREFFKHAEKLVYFGSGIIDEEWDYSGFKFPKNIRGLRFQDLRNASFPFLLPYLNQLRKLDLQHQPNCQCFFFKRCPNLEVLVTRDKCGDEGFQLIGQFCKKLRKLTHYGRVAYLGLKAVAQGCPDLDYLKVHPYMISNEALECVGTHLKKLCDFRITESPENGGGAMLVGRCILDKGVRAMLEGCSKLERLDIHLYFGILTNAGLEYIGNYGRNLRYLSLCNTGESDFGLFDLLKGCPRLRKLRLSSCPFSEQILTMLVFNINHSIRYISVDSVRVLARPEVLRDLYVTLAEKLQRLAVQLVADGSGAESVKIRYTSSRVTDDLDTPLVRNLVEEGIWNEERLILNASFEKQLKIIVQIAEVESRVAVAVSEFGEIQLQGMVKDGVPHLTKVGAFKVDVSLEGNIILCTQADQANTIGRVTSILGEENVNINSMSVGRPAPRIQAVMVIGIDEKPSEEALKKIDDAVEEFVFLTL